MDSISYTGLGGLLFMALFCNSAAAIDCPGAFYGLACDGGSGPDNCTRTADDGEDDDDIAGDEGNDLLSGGPGDDTINGNTGLDGISGGAGNDVLYGGAGNDALCGDLGDDMLDGQGDDDQLWGSGTADWLDGGTHTNGDECDNNGTYLRCEVGIFNRPAGCP
jgi:hypothetical protein